jgi:hypothetical protein
MSSVKFKSPRKKKEQDAVKALKKHIRDLSVLDRNALWGWLDGNPDAIHELIDAAAENTPDISDPAVREKIAVKEAAGEASCMCNGGRGWCARCYGT